MVALAAKSCHTAEHRRQVRRITGVQLQLQAQTAVIIGAAQGIGNGIARAFAQERAAVAMLDRDPQVKAAAQEIAEASGAATLPLVADVTDFAALQAAAQQIQQRFGRIDHVIHAAAVGSGKFGFPFWNLQPGDWPRVLEVNVLGAVNVAHTFVPYLRDARRGTMLFISSVAGQIGSQTDPPYSASKAALINFAQCAAKDLAPYNVRVNTLCPGMVKTAVNRAVWEAWARQQPPEERRSYEDWADEKVRRMVPLGRWQTVEDIAAMALFLASARAENITGQTINVDGGFVMHW
jgi:NAD(P)-dependent dehydrogenase (short-subunit alcohol dehydrogenase family)